MHGQQELALFNAHYHCTCFQQIHIFDGLTGKPVLSLLRPGKRPSGEEVAKVRRYVIARIRRHWPHVEILVRGDSHYRSKPALVLLEAIRCDYIVGFAVNSKLLSNRLCCQTADSDASARRYRLLPSQAFRTSIGTIGATASRRAARRFRCARWQHSCSGSLTAQECFHDFCMDLRSPAGASSSLAGLNFMPQTCSDIGVGVAG